MALEEQIRVYWELGKKIESLEQERKALGSSIMQQMEGRTLKVSDFFVRRMGRFSIKLTLEEARTFDAIKIEETIDREKIKALYQSGQCVDGVSETEYIQVSLK